MNEIFQKKVEIKKKKIWNFSREKIKKKEFENEKNSGNLEKKYKIWKFSKNL